MLSKVRAEQDRQPDAHRHTERRDRTLYHAAFTGGNKPEMDMGSIYWTQSDPTNYVTDLTQQYIIFKDSTQTGTAQCYQ